MFDRVAPAERAWGAKLLPRVLGCWARGRRFDFQIERREPSLQSTEMWLRIAWLMADQLGSSSVLGCPPRGVHRPEVAGEGLVQSGSCCPESAQN